MVAIDQQVWQSSGRGSAWLLSNKATRSSSTAWWNAFLKKRGNQIGAVSFTMMMMMMVVTLSCRNQHHVTVRRFSSIPKETPSSRQKPQRGHTVEDLLHKHDHSMRTVAGDYTGDSKHLAPVLQGGKETAASRSFNELKTVVSSSKQVAMTTPLPSAEQASQLPSLQSPPTVPVVLNSTTIPTKKPRQVVIVFGVCLSKIAQRQAQRSEFGTNSGQHQHSKKPYDVAAILATRLWIQQYPSLKVVVLLATKTTATLRSHSLGVPSPLEEETIRMSKLVRAAGGIPWVVNTDYSSNPERACVRAAQLGRAFLYESGLVEDDDIIVTSDSDAFPINATARLAPLRQLMDSDSDEARVWISNYGHALRNKKTIPFCFIGQSASDWRLSWQMTPHNLTFRDAVERSVAAGNSTTTKQSRSVSFFSFLTCFLGALFTHIR